MTNFQIKKHRWLLWSALIFVWVVICILILLLTYLDYPYEYIPVYSVVRY